VQVLRPWPLEPGIMAEPISMQVTLDRSPNFSPPHCVLTKDGKSIVSPHMEVTHGAPGSQSNAQVAQPWRCY
jgi:hypothetical protein